MENSLVNKKINVVPIIRNSWLPKGHDGQFLFSGKYIELEVKMDANTGYLKDPLLDVTKATKEKIVEAFALEGISDLNIHKRDNNFWTDTKRTVKIDRNGLLLDLSDPIEFVKYRQLCGYTDNYISPSWEERNNKLTYKFSFRDEDTVVENNAITEIDKIAAYTKFGMMQSNINDMYDFLLVYYYSTKKDRDYFPSLSWNIEKYLDKIGTLIEKDVNKFVTIIQDKNYKYKVLIYKGLNLGLLEFVNKNKYQVVGTDNPLGTLEDTIIYLSDKKNNQEYLELKAKVEQKSRQSKV